MCIPSLEVIAAPPVDLPSADLGLTRQRWFDDAGRLVAFGGTSGDRCWMRWPGLGTYAFGPTGPVSVAPVPGADPAQLRDSFVRGVLPVALLAREHEAFHASAVSFEDGVVAFCARSGTGKSSLALGIAARHGRRHWADDTVMLRVSPDAVECLALPFPARVDAGARAALGGAPVVDVEPGTRAPLERVYLMVRDAALDPATPVVTDVPPARAFERLLAHAHAFDLGPAERRRRMIERLLTAARVTRVCELRFAPSLEHLPALVACVERHLSDA